MGIHRLIEETSKIQKEPRYQQLKGFWKDFYSRKEHGRVPVTVDMNNAFWAKMLDVNLLEVYEKPEKHVEYQLRAKIFRHREFRDDAPFWGGVAVSFGNAFEASLLGVKPVFRPDTDPWRGDPTIRSDDDLEKLEFPDFYKSGLMPKVHEFYEKIRKIAGRDIRVAFPGCVRGLWGLANDLRGMQNILVDTFRNPDLVNKIMRFVTEYRIRFEKERAAFLGTEIGAGILGNDEVNCNVISPRIYDKFIFPYEQKLADFYPEGISYYHSCGNLTPILDRIIRLRGLKRLHISPWTDFRIATEKFGEKVIFQRRLHPVDDVLLRSSNEMKEVVERALKIGYGLKMELAAGPFETGPLEKMQTWINVSKKAVSDLSSRDISGAS